MIARRSQLPLKTFLNTILLAGLLAGGACSRAKKPAENIVELTPNPRLRSDSEQLQTAVAKEAKAAEEREQAEQLKQSPAPSPPQP
ncbi:MAG: hypothetical protein DLM73_10095 [Chthoniobacterales bacterium]|nr:MAG: hypothetical protein DLM73_10095 [Chthoniobacterales bacterium]